MDRRCFLKEDFAGLVRCGFPKRPDLNPAVADVLREDFVNRAWSFSLSTERNPKREDRSCAWQSNREAAILQVKLTDIHVFYSFISCVRAFPFRTFFILSPLHSIYVIVFLTGFHRVW
jgi:hypothetical protein